MSKSSKISNDGHYLSRAENDFLDSLRILRSRSVVLDGSLELSSGHHVIKAGLALGMTKQRLGSHDDERLAERQRYLATQNVEIVGGTGAVGHDHVDVTELLDGELVFDGREVLRVVGTKLEEAFRSC